MSFDDCNCLFREVFVCIIMLSSFILFVFEYVFVFIEKEGNLEYNYLGWVEKKG